jgi:hypothetical protein
MMLKCDSFFRKFDLKGSTVDREASDKELDKSLPTFKDNDFIKQGIKIRIGMDAKQRLNESLAADVDVSCLIIFNNSNFVHNLNPFFILYSFLPNSI